ncbi:MAG: cell division protein FtsQ/DivIB, partial [Actinomycetota bacterium]|nr:cell division protein FtsQ/DivIB [Actinomycetota bacterium]
LGWVLLASPVLALDVERVVVTGAGTVVHESDLSAVVDAVAGVPLPRLDTIGLRSAVLDVPGVREARVTRAWPRGLAISLVAREPVAAVPDSEGVQLLDVEGIAVGRGEKAPKGLPLVEVPVGDARTLAAVLGVLEALPPELAEDVRSVAAQTQDTVTMELRGGARVDWGSADQTELKAAVLQALRTAKGSKKATWFDVSAPTLPVTKS